MGDKAKDDLGNYSEMIFREHDNKGPLYSREGLNQRPDSSHSEPIVEVQMRTHLVGPLSNKQPRNTSNLNLDNQYYANSPNQ